MKKTSRLRVRDRWRQQSNAARRLYASSNARFLVPGASAEDLEATAAASSAAGEATAGEATTVESEVDGGNPSPPNPGAEESLTAGPPDAKPRDRLAVAEGAFECVSLVVDPNSGAITGELKSRLGRNGPHCLSAALFPPRNSF